jgi:phage shock protein A
MAYPMPSIADTTDTLLRARQKALDFHAWAAAQASRRAKTPEERIAHAEIEQLLRSRLAALDESFNPKTA